MKNFTGLIILIAAIALGLYLWKKPKSSAASGEYPVLSSSNDSELDTVLAHAGVLTQPTVAKATMTKTQVAQVIAANPSVDINDLIKSGAQLSDITQAANDALEKKWTQPAGSTMKIGTTEYTRLNDTPTGWQMTTGISNSGGNWHGLINGQPVSVPEYAKYVGAIAYEINSSGVSLYYPGIIPPATATRV